MPTIKQYDDDCYTITAGATLSPYIRVKIDSSGELQAAAAADASIGYLTERGSTVNEPAPVRSCRAPSFTAVAVKAIAVGDIVYAAAAGKVTDAATGVQLGYALTSAAADTEIILVLASDETA